MSYSQSSKVLTVYSKERKNGSDEYEIVLILEAKHGNEVERSGARKLVNMQILHSDKHAQTCCASPLFRRVSCSLVTQSWPELAAKGSQSTSSGSEYKQLTGRCLAWIILLAHSNVAHWSPKITRNIEQVSENYFNKFLLKTNLSRRKIT